MRADERFPVVCSCPLHRYDACARNMTDCQLPWVVAENARAQPSIVERIVGWLADLIGRG